MNGRRMQVGVMVLGMAGMVAAYSAGRLHAGGIPTTSALSYGGLLLSNGAPLASVGSLQVRVYDAATDGTLRCSTEPAPMALVQGRFRVQLPDTCLNEIAARPNLWAEVEADGTVLPRARLGAVPYAVEARHAVNADNATQAANASALSGPATATTLAVSGNTTLGTGGAPFSALKKMTVSWDCPATNSAETERFQVDLPAGAVVVGIVPPRPPTCGGYGCVFSSAGWGDKGGLQGHHSFKTVGSVTFEFLNATGGVIDPPPSDWDIWFIQP